MKIKRTHTFIIGIILCLFLVAIISYTKVVNHDIFHLYESSNHALQFTYPASWTVDDTVSAVNIIALDADNPKIASGVGLISTLTIRRISHASSTELHDRLISQEGSTKERAEVNGRAAEKISYRSDFDGGKVVVYILPVAENVYTIHYAADTSFVAQFEKIVESISFAENE
ncbi:hypothetical protein A3C87_01545 [Candidatus Kaiserbacteria bacterium RIFCSPHIGHO2_02_FULL_49_34]|uniref:PsbP C-terminal domain-containing protein n=1 Tax=Candidatus Kaiserbacteria bacterium RIFCSPHIGHO2_02_FULL_49_34 TaxID=1798491 RepID=A0A1F6DJR6_9BACT|nr:MAG: hypothetical protein A3C87_01545 [Candidatus Kaiserbacteria bacterium RIFCSPHIGHO2_02_FULL_49_34]